MLFTVTASNMTGRILRTKVEAESSLEAMDKALAQWRDAKDLRANNERMLSVVAWRETDGNEE